MENICPYCKGELSQGYIDSGRFSFKWYGGRVGIIERLTVFGGEVLSDEILVKCYRCENCNKIIIDLDEL